jgi:hypothetical protein
VPGWVAEWFKAAVLKTADPQGFVGSNPTPSATTPSAGDAHEAGRRNAKHAAQWRATLTAYVYPHMGDLPVGTAE